MSDRDRMAEPGDCGLDAAPYVLGALEPGEARAFVRHLERCAVCRDEVAALAPVLDALPAAAPPRPVRAALRRRVLRAVHAEPRAAFLPSGDARRGSRPRPVGGSRRRPVGPTRAAPAGWLALAVAIAAVLVMQLGASHPRARVISAAVGRAELRVADGHGELIVEHLAPLPADRVYELWLQSGRVGGRDLMPSTLFAVTARGGADIGVPGELRDVSGLLVTVEPRGGSLVPTGRTVIQLALGYVQRSSPT